MLNDELQVEMDVACCTHKMLNACNILSFILKLISRMQGVNSRAGFILVTTDFSGSFCEIFVQLVTLGFQRSCMYFGSVAFFMMFLHHLSNKFYWFQLNNSCFVF